MPARIAATVKPAPQNARRMDAVAEAIIPVIADLVRKHPGTISLGQGVVSYPPPPGAIEYAVRKMQEPGNHAYGPVGGLELLHDAIRAKLAARNGITVGDAQTIFVTAGGNMAFHALMLAICNPGDEVMLLTPYYFNHEMTARMCGCRVVTVGTDARHHPEVGRIADAVTPATRAIVTVSPNNPTGSVYPTEVLADINTLCAKHGIYHISDEAYEDFVYREHRHCSPGALPDAAAHTLSLFSLSKSYGFASWRIGYMVIPKTLSGAVTKVQDNVLICPPTISQLAAVKCLQDGSSYVREQRRAIQANRKLCLEALHELSDQGLVERPCSEGAFYIFLQLRRAVSDCELAKRLIERHRVATIPGSAFGIPQDRTCLRISYAALSADATAEGIGRLCEGLRE